MYSFGKTSTANLKGVHPDLVKVLTAAIIDSPIDFTINQGVRSLAEQEHDYAQGRTTKGEIITYDDGVKHKSHHQVRADGYGHAVDLYPYVDGDIKYNDTRRLGVIAEHIKATGKGLGITVNWGGDWVNKSNFKDYPHFELSF